MLWLAMLALALQSLSKEDERWLDSEIGSIITEEEAQLFKILPGAADRETFRTIFWARRDPDPDTPVNEFQEEFHRQMAIANERFRARLGPGSSSEMGQVFLLLGFPASVGTGRANVAIHADGSVPEGLEGSSTELAPPGQRGSFSESASSGAPQRVQTWKYPSDEAAGLPDGLEVRFRAQPGYGYRIVPSDDVERAFERRRRAFIARPDVDYIRDDEGHLLPLPSRTSLAASILDDLIKGAPSSDDVAFDVTPAFFKSVDGTVYAPLLFEVDTEAVVFGSVQPLSGGPTQRFEVRGTEVPLQLTPGDYLVHLGVLDETLEAHGSRQTSLHVPRFAPTEMALSSVVLYSGAERTDQRGGVPGRAFQFGSVRVNPRASKPFSRGDTLGLFFYVYFPDDRQPNLTARYVFYRDGQESAQTEPNPILAGTGQALASDEISLASFEPGEYRVVIIVKDEDTGETLEQRVGFRLVR